MSSALSCHMKSSISLALLLSVRWPRLWTGAATGANGARVGPSSLLAVLERSRLDSRFSSFLSILSLCRVGVFLNLASRAAAAVDAEIDARADMVTQCTVPGRGQFVDALLFTAAFGSAALAVSS